MNSDKKFIVRCRAIILHKGKLLVVRHPVDTSFCALPGGHLEWGEGIKECMSREIIEELEIKPEIGRLLYVHTFIEKDGKQPIEFFFEVKNGADYKSMKAFNGSHKHELAEVYWASSNDPVRILPEELARDFKAGKLLSDETRYINAINSQNFTK